MTQKDLISNNMLEDVNEESKSLLSYCKPDFAMLGIGFAALFLNSYTNVMFPRILGKAVDGFRGDSCSVRQICISTSGWFLLGSFASWVRTFCIGTARERIAQRIRRDVFTSYLNRDLEADDAGIDGDFVNLVEKDSVAASELYTENLSSILRSINSSIAGSISLYCISPSLCFTSLSIVPVVGILAMTVSKLANKLKDKLLLLESKIMSFSLERISHISTVRLNGKSDHEIKKFDVLLRECELLALNSYYYKGAFMGFINLSTNTALLAVLYQGGKMISSGDITVGSLTQFALQSGFVGLGFSGLSSIMTDWRKGNNAFKRISYINSRKKEENCLQCSNKYIDMNSCDIKIKDLQFSYSSRNENVIKNLTASMPAGSITIFTGKSGSGKSTLISLLTGLYKPTSGVIEFNGVNLSDLDRQLILSKVGIVEQDGKLLSGSIYENISYGASICTKADVIRAATQASAHNFIMSFPKGYETEVGENGSFLSGGQRIRIALARALIKNPSVLFLDEVTSALDKDSELAICESISSLRGNTTIVISTHSRSLLALANNIYIIEDGNILLNGRPETIFNQLNIGIDLE